MLGRKLPRGEKTPKTRGLSSQGSISAPQLSRGETESLPGGSAAGRARSQAGGLWGDAHQSCADGVLPLQRRVSSANLPYKPRWPRPRCGLGRRVLNKPVEGSLQQHIHCTSQRVDRVLLAGGDQLAGNRLTLELDPVAGSDTCVAGAQASDGIVVSHTITPHRGPWKSGVCLAGHKVKKGTGGERQM